MTITFLEAPAPIRALILALLTIFAFFFFAILLGTLRHRQHTYSAFNALIILLIYGLIQFLASSLLSRQPGSFFSPSLSVLFIIFDVLIVLGAHALFHLLKYQHSRITHSSIKRGTDTLTTGLCYYYPDGMVKLCNSLMTKLCIHLLGKEYVNGNDLWTAIKARASSEDNLILSFADLGVFRFSRSVINVEGTEIYEIIASDITDIYHVNNEIEQKNRTLAQMNARLREFSENVTSITIEKEILDAKISIHDEMGHAMLAGRRYLTSGGNRQELLTIWENSVLSLQEASREVDNTDEYELMQNTAQDVGVKLTICGELPSEPVAKHLTATAIHECLTNTIRHAEGTALTIDSTPTDLFYIIRFTNDGIQPAQPLRESGGLRSLRQLAEKSGAEMFFEFSPQYTLVLKIPKMM